MSASVKIHIDDVRIKEIQELVPPAHVLREFPATAKAAEVAYEARQAIHRILYGADDRLLVVIGPCSIHDPIAAIEYAHKLKAEAEKAEIAIKLAETEALYAKEKALVEEVLALRAQRSKALAKPDTSEEKAHDAPVSDPNAPETPPANPEMTAVNSACVKLYATNDTAPRLYTSSGDATSTAFTNDDRSAKSPDTGSMNGNSSNTPAIRGLFCPFTIPNTSYPSA